PEPPAPETGPRRQSSAGRNSNRQQGGAFRRTASRTGRRIGMESRGGMFELRKYRRVALLYGKPRANANIPRPSGDVPRSRATASVTRESDGSTIDLCAIVQNHASTGTSHPVSVEAVTGSY